MITALTFSPAVDVTYLVDDLVEGRTHRPSRVEKHPGGKALNLARAAAALGAEVQVVAPLSKEAIETFRAGLGADGVELIAVPVADPVRMCVSVASAATGLMTEIYEHPPTLAARDIEAVSDRTRSVARGWLAVSGSMSAGAVPALGRLLGAGTRVAVDTHGEALAGALTAHPAIVKVNRAEAEAAVGARSDVVALTHVLYETTGGICIVTDSTAGVVVTDGAGTWRLRLPDVVGRYPQGSGDSMLGGLLAALDAGAGLLEATVLGTAAAAANALIPGAGRFDLETVHTLRDRVEVVPG